MVFHLLTLGVLLSQAVPLGKGLPGDKPQVTVTALRPATTDVSPGEAFEVAFDLEIPAGFHIYPAGKPIFGTPTVFTLEGAEGAGGIVEPAPKIHKEPALTYDYHEGRVTILVPFRLKPGPPTGPLEAKGRIAYQICDANQCFDNETPFSIKLSVTEDPALLGLSVAPAQADVKSGEIFTVTVAFDVPKDWHIYPTSPGKSKVGSPTEFKFGAAEVAGPIEGPKAKVHPFESETKPEYEYHEGKVAFRVPVRLKPGPKPGPFRVSGAVEYWICDPKTCIPADTHFSFLVNVVEGEVKAAQAGGAAEESAREFEEKGLGWLLGLAVAGGLISLVMPCVYPLIPITLTFFVKQAGASRGAGFLLSSAYATGIVLTFTGLGFLLTLLLGPQGAQIFASDPWVNLAVAFLFGLFALSMLGLFEIKLPAALTDKLAGGGPKSGLPGAFILGLLFSVVTFTCTIPIAATILGVAASGKHALAGLLAMLVYSGVMAVPFLLLGLFPSMIKELPRSGGWLHTVKVTAGFFEIALAAAYIWKADLVWGWGVFDRGLVLAIFIAVCFVIAAYLLGLFRLKEDPETRETGFGRLATAILFGILGFYLIGGVMGRPVGVFNTVLPPEERVASKGSPLAGPKVYEDLAEAEAAAKRENKPLFVEFTGVT